jgi:CBS-domain-containing membrane protein
MRRAVEDVMTRDVVCAHEGTPYKELVRLLASRRVSAVPVIDGRRHVLGVVSEADLLLKQDQPTRPAVRLLSVLRRPKDQKGAGDHCRGADEQAGDHHRPRATLAEAARRLHAVGSSGCR